MSAQPPKDPVPTSSGRLPAMKSVQATAEQKVLVHEKYLRWCSLLASLIACIPAFEHMRPRACHWQRRHLEMQAATTIHNLHAATRFTKYVLTKNEAWLAATRFTKYVLTRNRTWVVAATTRRPNH